MEDDSDINKLIEAASREQKSKKRKSKQEPGDIPSIPNPLDAGDDLLSGSSSEEKPIDSMKAKTKSTGLGSLLSAMSDEADDIDSVLDAGEKDKSESDSADSIHTS